MSGPISSTPKSILSPIFEANQELLGDQSNNVSPPKQDHNYQIMKVLPRTYPLEGYAYETLFLKVLVKVDSNEIDVRAVIIEAQTNLNHYWNTEGKMETYNFKILGEKDDEHFVFGLSFVCGCAGSFQFSLRHKLSFHRRFKYLKPYDNAIIQVHTPRALTFYSDLFKVPYLSPFIGPVWVGNAWAGNEAINDNFTHVLVAGEELECPHIYSSGVCFFWVPFKQGPENPLDEVAFRNAVFWICRCIREQFKILVYSKHGFGRAGSVMVGLVMAAVEDISYEDALEKARTRRPIVPHINLKQLCTKYFRDKNAEDADTDLEKDEVE